MEKQGIQDEAVSPDSPDGAPGQTLIDELEQTTVEGGDRGSWDSKLEFLLTCVGFAVGLGNVWRFPYLCYKNGGGAFLVPYILMLVFIGMPIFYMEMGFGQFPSLGPITAYCINPLHKGVGLASVIVAAYIVLYYNVIVAWCLYYFFASMTDVLPWVDCNNWWNTDDCYDGTTNLSANATNTKSPAEEYYYNNVLRMSDGIEDIGGIVWQLALCLLVAWITIFIVILKGVSSLGKASYFVSLFPYVLLTILLIRGCTLPGAGTGIEYYLIPDWERLLDFQVWSDAATQIFYSLGCGHSSLIAMASFNKFHNRVNNDAILIPIINCSTSIYAGFVIFSVLGYMAEMKGVPMDEVADEGPGLVFVVYPEGLATMPAAPFWAILFFFMMATLGFSSQFSTVEGVCAAFMDEFPDLLRKGMRPTYLRAAFCTSCFLLGLPHVCEGGFYLFTMMDTYSASYTLLVVGFMELATIMWVYGFNRFAEDLAMMVGKRPGWFYRICWCGLSAAIIVVTIFGKALTEETLTLGDYVYPDWAMAICWLIVAFPLTVIVLYYLGRYLYMGGWQLLIDLSKPTEEWGPATQENRMGRYYIPDLGTSSGNDSLCKSGSLFITAIPSQPNVTSPSGSSRVTSPAVNTSSNEPEELKINL